MFSKEEFNKMTDDKIKDFSSEEKAKYFEFMMEKCCNNDSKNEAEKVKSSAMGGSSSRQSNPIMGMMSTMMQGNRDARGNMNMMKKMCSDMMSGDSNKPTDESFGTSELEDLFFDWLDLLKTEVKNFMKDSEKLSADDIAAHFKLSKESVEFILKSINPEE